MSTVTVLPAEQVLACLENLRTKMDSIASRLPSATTATAAGDPHRYRNLKELGDLLGYNRSTLRPICAEGVHKGKIRWISSGRSRNYCVQDVIDYLSH